VTHLEFGPVLHRLPFLLGGVVTTIALSALTFSAGLCLAIVLAAMRQGNHEPVRRVSIFYGTALTNTPQLSQIFAIFYCLPLTGLVVSPFVSVAIGMTLNGSAYLAEIVVAGLAMVPPLQHEVARSLGLTRLQAFSRVILPHALQTMFPALANHFQIMILGSSMASVFGVQDLTGRAYDVGSTTFRILEVMLVTAALYVGLSFLLAAAFHAGRRAIGRAL